MNTAPSHTGRLTSAEQLRRQQMTPDQAKRHRLRRARLQYDYYAAKSRDVGEAAKRELLSEEMRFGPTETCHWCGGNHYQHRWIHVGGASGAGGVRWAVTDIRDYQCKYCRANPGHPCKAVYS